MCGLTAVYHSDGIARPSPDVLEGQLRTSMDFIKHRGPDSAGTYVSSDGRVGLGHVRLAIIDLETGQQPLSDEDELIHCVVTGEIYDHDRIGAEMESEGFKFKTKSDSELVVQLYKRDGINMLTSLRGEFAFVLYDVKRRLLFAARDRFGIRPLYYTIHKGRILFASEMKAFMGLGWQAEWDLDSIAHNGDLGDERTVFKGAFKLAAGHFALCGPSGYMRTERYWDLSYPTTSTPSPHTSIDEMISTVRAKLVESVRLRLRADVPLAIYLSGGIDSSSVAGIVTHLLREKDPNARVAAFTLDYTENETTNELPVAKRTAAHLGADIHAVNGSEAALVDVLEESIWHSEQMNTTFHGAGKLLLSRAVRKNGYKVALSGEGSDELFGGYRFLSLDYLRNADPAGEQLGLALPTEAERRVMIQELERGSGVREMSAEAIDDTRGGSNLLPVTAHHVVTMMNPFDSRLLHPKVVAETGKPELVRTIAEGVDARVRQRAVDGSWHSLHTSMYVTAKTMLGKLILNQAGDRNDMTNAIESRIAFLDHHLVEYVNTLPPSVKVMPIATGDKWTLTEKWILRQAVRPFVTDELFNRKKTYYNPPPARADKGLVPLQIHLQKRITRESVERLGFFDWGYVEERLKGYLDRPTYSPHGAIDERARMLMVVLSFIVLQERFNVPKIGSVAAVNGFH